jgi:hypothetical protein
MEKEYCYDDEGWSAGEISPGVTKAKYCKDYLKTIDNWTYSDDEGLNTACGFSILYNKIENVFEDQGCGLLCESDGNPDNYATDVNIQWCNNKRKEYCTDNMFTNKCLEFCVYSPEDCEDNIKELCEAKKISDGISNDYSDIRRWLKTTVAGTKYTNGDWCACNQSSEFYNEYYDRVISDFTEAGIDISVVLANRAEECDFQLCANKRAYKNPAQLFRLARDGCGSDCTQIAILALGEGTSLDDVAVDTNQECTVSDIKNEVGDKTVAIEDTQTENGEYTQDKEFDCAPDNPDYPNCSFDYSSRSENETNQETNQTSAPTSSPNQDNNKDNNQDDKQPYDIGLIVGASVGGLALIVIIALIIWYSNRAKPKA